ncbi:MAG: hypothetical protein IJB68_09235 [Ruminococcus sp.]|nr:hypothetical protein [Ruminococcus sp.]
MAGASLVFFIIFFIIYGLILLASLAMAVVQIIATWKLYEKAGEPGWTSIVPVYYYMQQIKIATGSFKLAWIYLGLTAVYIVGCLVMSFAEFIENSDMADIILIVSVIICFITIIPICVIAGYIYYMFPKSYGKSQLFCILSIFFPQIMVIIMGFDKSTQYVGPKGVPMYNNYNNYF